MAIYIQIMSKRTHFFKLVGRSPPPFPLSSEKVPQRELHGSSTSARGRGREQSYPRRNGGTQLPVLWTEGLSDACTTTQGPGVNTHSYNSGWIRPQSGTDLQGRSSGSIVPSTHVLQLSTNWWWSTHTSTSLWSLKAEVEEETLFQHFFMACHESNPGVQRVPMQVWWCFLQGTIIKVRFSFQCVLSTRVLKASGPQMAGKDPDLFYLLSCALLGGCIMPVWRWEPHLSCLLGCCNLLCPELIISNCLEAAASC